MLDVSVRGLTKQFGRVCAVRDLTFDVPAGQVTGFLGPNGAGKTTTLRILLGLVTPTAGEALIGGRRYADAPRPRRTVGAVLEATGFHPGRRGRDHLRILAQVGGAPPGRVADVLDLVGLAKDGDRRVGGYSLGMRQRLGMAAALLDNPRVLVLDEPANGLDPAGMAWLRDLLRDLAAEGRTVLISSHVLAEVQQTVDRVVILHEGRLRFTGTLRELADPAVSVRTPQHERLRRLLVGQGYRVDGGEDSALVVRGATAEQIGSLAADHGITLSALADTNASLEAAFLRLTSRADPVATDATAGFGITGPGTTGEGVLDLSDTGKGASR